MNTKLQLALDDITLEDALFLLEKIQPYIDIIEIGTPFMMKYGMYAVQFFKENFPKLELLCDGKIMDAGYYESMLTYQAGADYSTVLAVTDDQTIRDIVKAAKETGKKAVADTICVQNLKERVLQLKGFGIDMISIHTGVDQQSLGRTPLDDLREVRDILPDMPLSVAGGINPATISSYLEYHPEVIIVGSGITHATDPVAAAKALSYHCRQLSSAPLQR